MCGELTPVQYSVFAFIVQRTLKYNKESERIPLRHFLDGVYSSRNKNPIIAGLKVSKPTLIEAISTLGKLGFISHVKNSTGNLFIVNTSNIQNRVKNAMLKLSKKYKASLERSTTEQDNNSTRSKIKPLVVKNKTANIRINKKTKRKEGVSDALRSPVRSIEEKVDIIRKQYQNNISRAAKEKQQSVSSLSVQSILTVWNKIAPTSITQKEASILCRNFKNIKMPESLTWDKLLIWSITSWKYIVTSKFSWMCNTPPPLVPDGMFMAKFVRYFVSYWVELENDPRREFRRNSNAVASSSKDVLGLGNLLDVFKETQTYASGRRKRG